MSEMNFQFADILECLCDTGPDSEILVAGERSTTRAELDRRANQLAHHLVRRGVQRGQHVGIYAHNRVEWVESLLACWKIGAAAVNINFRYVEAELRTIWQQADLVALIFERRFAPLVASLADHASAPQTYLVLEDATEREGHDLGPSYEDALALESHERGFEPRSGNDIYLVYTGGTTGMPKGVLWRHEDWYFNVAHFLSPQVVNPDDVAKLIDNPLGMRTLTLSPLMHGGGQFPLMLTLFSGGVGLFPVSRHFDADEVLAMIARHRATTVSIIGDAMGRPLAETRLRSGGAYDCSSLRAISTGGALLTDPVRALLRQAFGKIFITGGIGSSEIGAAARETRSDPNDATLRFRLEENVSVLDDDLQPVRPGSSSIGRLARKGHIPLGYYKDAEKTHETFPIDASGTRWVIPGDFAKVESDGTFVLLGRGSSCINTGGEKVFPDEVESAVALHPLVRGAAVVGIPDPRWMQRIVALIELETPNAQLTLEDLQSHCREHLAGYKIPRALVVTELVRTPAGKVDQVWAVEFAQRYCATR